MLSLRSGAAPSELHEERALRVAALLLIVVEYLIVSVAIDARDLRAGLGIGAVSSLGVIGPFVVGIAAAFALLGGRRVLEVTRATTEARSRRSSRGSFALHGASFVAFLALSVVVGRGPSLPAPTHVIALTWTLLATLVVVTWIRFAVPVDVRAWALGEGRATIALSIVVGTFVASSGFVASALWPSLSTATAFVAALVLALVPGRLIADPHGPLVGLDDFIVEIAPVCSGIEGIGLMSALVATYLLVFRRELRFPRAFALLPIAIVAAFFANAIRIAALVVVGARLSPALAIGAFHSKAGWVAFCAIGLGMLFVAHRYVRRDAGTRSAIVRGPVALYLAPELVLLATSLITGLFAQGFDRFYALRIVTTGLVLVVGRKVIERKPGSPHRVAGAVVVGLLAFAAWRLLGGTPSVNDALASHLAASSSLSRSVHFAVRVVGSVVVVPIAEELAFRGFLARAIESRSFDEVDPRRLGTRALVLSSLVFALLHTNVLGAFAAGLAYALVYRWRGELRDAVVAHAATNALVALEAIVLGPSGSF